MYNLNKRLIFFNYLSYKDVLFHYVTSNPWSIMIELYIFYLYFNLLN